MKFSKEKFLKYADKATKDRVRPHLDILAGGYRWKYRDEEDM